MQVIRKILIANRGEIARRIIRTTRSMGIGTLAVYTAEEKEACHVLEADEAVLLGSGTLVETYLNITLIIQLAGDHGCDAIHPGYGFLSENAEFAEACKHAGMLFIGPSSDHIRLMGNKKEARSFVEKLGIPLPFSFSGTTIEELVSRKLPYPLIIKAVAGGGGKGMRLVNGSEELKEAWESAAREAGSYFGNPELYLEQYIQEARHIEVQVLGDIHGQVVHLFERECTIQRRHQKIVEEAPSMTLNDQVREKLLQSALHIANSMGYTSAGTLEFLMDKDLNFYFLEMNTRIQVEHPVTEKITGVDIVREQILIASGQPLSLRQEDIKPEGHAIECRVYAEDPFQGFLPSSGEMVVYHLPQAEGIRLDSAFTAPGIVSGSFDPMIAKVVVHEATRDRAIEKLGGYLRSSLIHGIQTNLEYLSLIMEEADYRQNSISTHYCEDHQELLEALNKSRKEAISSHDFLAAGMITLFYPAERDGNLWQRLGPWRNIIHRKYKLRDQLYELIIQLDGRGGMKISYEKGAFYAQYLNHRGAELLFRVGDRDRKAVVSQDKSGNFLVSIRQVTEKLLRDDLPVLTREEDVPGRSGGNGHIVSPINGRVVRLNVQTGDKVRKGEVLIIIESMKMENRIVSPGEGKVTEVLVSEGNQVAGKSLLLKMKMNN